MKSDRVYLQHILEAIERIETYVSVGHDTFMSTTHWQDAVIQQLEVIGEATKLLSPDVRMQHPTIPWRRIAGMRDVLIHGYMSVDLAIVWEVTQQQLPMLKRGVQTILDEDTDGTAGNA